nr:proline-rich receptor-like protein kinase PERK3 isoform X2 [Arachis hypogaea]
MLMFSPISTATTVAIAVFTQHCHHHFYCRHTTLSGLLRCCSKFSAIYKRVLRDGSSVVIRSINVTCCIPEEIEFLKGLSLLTSLRHENIIKMRGFCYSSSRGLGYLHSNEASKPTMVHQNILVEKVLLDNQFNPLIMDAGFPKLLADDIVYSAPKVGAAMGYLAPEYITTGRITEKSDVYAFGVIVL